MLAMVPNIVKLGRKAGAAARFIRPKLSFNEIGKQFYKSNAHRVSRKSKLSQLAN
jgi:hypothetical protein